MDISEADHLAALNRLRQLAKLVSNLGEGETGEFGKEMRSLAAKLSDDAQRLEARLLEFGYISKVTTTPWRSRRRSRRE